MPTPLPISPAGSAQAFVINLQRSPERREWMQPQMEASGFRWAFWDATDARALPDPQYCEWFAGRFTDCPTLSRAFGTQASALSHLRLWHYLLALPPAEGVAFVFEDDVVIQAQMAARWAERVGELPEDWDIAYFGPWDDRCLDPGGRHSRHFFRLIRVEAVSPTHAYALNVRRLISILGKVLPLHEELDLHLGRRLAGLKLFVHAREDSLAHAMPDVTSVRRELDELTTPTEAERAAGDSQDSTGSS